MVTDAGADGLLMAKTDFGEQVRSGEGPRGSTEPPASSFFKILGTALAFNVSCVARPLSVNQCSPTAEFPNCHHALVTVLKKKKKFLIIQIILKKISTE